jgi:hypothetical protein
MSYWLVPGDWTPSVCKSLSKRQKVWCLLHR